MGEKALPPQITQRANANCVLGGRFVNRGYDGEIDHALWDAFFVREMKILVELVPADIVELSGRKPRDGHHRADLKGNGLRLVQHAIIRDDDPHAGLKVHRRYGVCRPLRERDTRMRSREQKVALAKPRIDRPVEVGQGTLEILVIARIFWFRIGRFEEGAEPICELSRR